MMKAITQSKILSRILAWGAMILLIAFALYYPKHIDKQNIWNLFFLICLQITLGQSWNILGGFAGQTSLGHAAFFGIGA